MPKAIISERELFYYFDERRRTRPFAKSLRANRNHSLRLSPNSVNRFSEWVEIAEVKDKYRQRILELQIDKGESSAIALALETSDSVVILDDYKARKIAERLGVTLTGTIGVIIKAKLNGTISSIKPILEKIKQTDFRLSGEIETQALKEADE